MVNPQVAQVGSITSHGGIIITGDGIFPMAGNPMSRVGDLHVCPITGHGVNIIVTGSSLVRASGIPVAYVGSLCSCGAVIIEGSGTVTSAV